MLLQLRSHATPRDLESIRALASELGYEVRTLDASGRVLELCRRADGRPVRPSAHHRSLFEDLAGVRAVLDNREAPELSERAQARADTVVTVAGAAFGGGRVSIIAGPCAVEDEGRLLEIARCVRDAGATLLRGGAFKPRTSPYSFQGLGEAGLALLGEVGRATGLGIVTELLDPRDVDSVLDVADMIQIGSRSMSNAALLVEAGRSGKPVLLKRGLAATARELLLAAEYVLSQDNPNVVLCERGIRGFDDVTRNVLDVGLVAHLSRATHLPVIVDPSHAAGRPDLVLPLARAGIAAGADGLIVEVHPEPSEARSDGAQAVHPRVFAELVAAVQGLLRLDGRELATLPAAGSTERALAEERAR